TLGKDESALAYFHGCKAMASYRLGRFREAIEWAEKASNSPIAELPANAKAFAVSAMANWQLGEKDAAHAALARGETLAPNFSPERGAVDLGESWVAWTMAKVSLDEATKLLQTGATIGE